MLRAALLALAISGCAGAGTRVLADPVSRNPSQPGPPGEPVYVNAGSGPLNAALMTGAAAAGSVIQRKAGGCYANCPAGTRCNRETGFCDEIPCRGLCAYDEECDSRGLIPRCVRSTRPPIELHEKLPAGSPPPQSDDHAPQL